MVFKQGKRSFLGHVNLSQGHSQRKARLGFDFDDRRSFPHEPLGMKWLMKCWTWLQWPHDSFNVELVLGDWMVTTLWKTQPNLVGECYAPSNMLKMRRHSLMSKSLICHWFVGWTASKFMTAHSWLEFWTLPFPRNLFDSSQGLWRY